MRESKKEKLRKIVSNTMRLEGYKSKLNDKLENEIKQKYNVKIHF